MVSQMYDAYCTCNLLVDSGVIAGLVLSCLWCGVILDGTGELNGNY